MKQLSQDPSSLLEAEPADNLPACGDRLVLHTRVVSGTGGGPDKTILNSPRFLKDRGYPMVCAYFRDPRDAGFAELERRAVDWQAPLRAIDDFGPLDTWSLANRVLDVCRELKPAIWHGHDYKSNLLGLYVRRHMPIELVTTVHGWVKQTWKTPVYYAIDRYCLRRYDKVVCVSEDLYRMCRKLGVPADRCWHVPNAIDTNEFQRRISRAEAKEKLGFAPHRILIGAVGRLSEEKGFHLLIRAINKLVQAGLNVELAIAGEGDQQDALTKLIAELDCGDRVRLLGFQRRPIDFYQAMDVFALSSIREGLPNVVLEAMALGTPVVATRIAGVPTLIDDGVNGIVIEPGSIDKLTSALHPLALDEHFRAKLGAAARATIEERYSFRQRMEKIRAIYETP